MCSKWGHKWLCTSHITRGYRTAYALDLPDEAGLLPKNLHINDWVRAVERRPGHVDLQRVCGDCTQAKDAQPQRQRAAATNRGANYG